MTANLELIIAAIICVPLMLIGMAAIINDAVAHLFGRYLKLGTCLALAPIAYLVIALAFYLRFFHEFHVL